MVIEMPFDFVAEVTCFFGRRLAISKAYCRMRSTPVRVKGTMIGVELGVEGAAVVQGCLQNGLLVNCTHSTVIRLLPSLTITDEQIDEGCDIIDDVMLSLKP